MEPTQPEQTNDAQAQQRAQAKSNNFDLEFRKLIEKSDETIRRRHGPKIDIGQNPDVLVNLSRYISIYNNMKPHEHYTYFEIVLAQNRNHILKTLESDDWLRKGNIVIQFGMGTKLAKKTQNIKIELSEIFRIACNLQDDAVEATNGVDENMIAEIGGLDLIRPQIILLHLFRIFYYLTEGPDKGELGKIVTHLETELGVTKKTVGAQPSYNEGGSESGGLSGLFNLATGMMNKMGYQPPPGLKPPSEGEISNVINTVFNNETTQNAIQSMFTSLQGCNDFGSAINTVVQNVTDPETMGAIQESVVSTATIAQQQNVQHASQAAGINPNPNPSQTGPQ